MYEPVAADIDIDEELAKIIGQESLKEEIRRYEYGSTAVRQYRQYGSTAVCILALHLKYHRGEERLTFIQGRRSAGSTCSRGVCVFF